MRSEAKPLNNTVALSFELAKRGVGPKDIAGLTEEQIASIGCHIQNMTTDNRWQPDLGQTVALRATELPLRELLFKPLGVLFNRYDKICPILRRRHMTRIGHLFALGQEGLTEVTGMSPTKTKYVHSVLCSVGLGLHSIPAEKRATFVVGYGNAYAVHSDFGALMFPLTALVLDDGEFELRCKYLSGIGSIDDLLDTTHARLLASVAAAAAPAQPSRPQKFASPVEDSAIAKYFTGRLLDMANFVDTFRAAQ